MAGLGVERPERCSLIGLLEFGDAGLGCFRGFLDLAPGFIEQGVDLGLLEIAHLTYLQGAEMLLVERSRLNGKQEGFRQFSPAGQDIESRVLVACVELWEAPDQSFGGFDVLLEQVLCQCIACLRRGRRKPADRIGKIGERCRRGDVQGWSKIAGRNTCQAEPDHLGQEAIAAIFLIGGKSGSHVPHCGGIKHRQGRSKCEPDHGGGITLGNLPKRLSAGRPDAVGSDTECRSSLLDLQ